VRRQREQRAFMTMWLAGTLGAPVNLPLAPSPPKLGH
jgi:hypothetical protein